VPGADLPCGNISPSGITGTAVADTARDVLWVVTISEGRSGPHHVLWGLNLASGGIVSEREADPPGSDPAAEQQRGALALYGTEVYIPYGGLYGDCSDYHGFLIGMSASQPASDVKEVFETPTQREGGIWAPGGAVIAGGSIWVATGNGTPTSVVDYANSVVRLSPMLKVQSSFTPADFPTLSAYDLDLGSTSPTILPGGVIFQVGKDGTGYLLDASHLGGVGGQLAASKVCGGAIGGTAVAGSIVFVDCYNGLYALRVRSGQNPRLSPLWSAKGFKPGPPVVAGSVVWTESTEGTLRGLVVATGQPAFSFAIKAAGSFPTLAAAGGMLYAADGNRLAAFTGL
jgi:hypothetical protein